MSVLVPLYQSEMAPKWIRGTLVCAYQFSITVGLLAASIVNQLTYQLPGAAAYQIPFGLQLTWAVVLSLGLLILPETPRYLIKRGDKYAAGLALSRLRRLDITHPALQEELAEIEANHEYELALGSASYRDVFTGSPHLGRRILTGCGLQMLQQLTGGYQLHYVLWNYVLFRGWRCQSLYDFSRLERYQRRLYCPGSFCGGKLGPSKAFNCRFDRDGYLSIGHRHFLDRRFRYERIGCKTTNCFPRLLRFLLRCLLGSSCLGGHIRDLSPQGSSEIHVDFYGIQLVA